MPAPLARLFLAVIALLTWAVPAGAQEPQKAVVIEASGIVDNFFRDGVIDRLDEARALGVDTVILELDTYGGLVSAGLELSRAIKQADDLHVIAFVDDKAISAGCMVALACDEIVMEPASQIGDCGVIAMNPGGGVQTMGETERAKQESPVLADFDDSARRNGYDPLLARSFVSVGAVVYAIEDVETGERRFVGPEQYEELTGGEGAAFRAVPDVPVPLDSAETLLTMGDETARRVGLSSGTYADVASLAADRGLDVVAVLAPSAGDRLVGLIGSPAVRGLLMVVLFLSVYAAFSAPGTGVPEVIAVVAAGALFGVPWLSGFAQWYEVLAVLLGVVLIALELFVIPGFGIFGLSGLLLIVGGLVMTFVAPVFPSDLPVGLGVDWADLGLGLVTTAIGLAASLLLGFWLARFLPRLPFARGLVLAHQEPTEEEQARAAAWPIVGSVGTAVSDLRPGGTARFAVTSAPGDTAAADVVCDRGFVDAGTPLRVVEVAGSRVVVRPEQSAAGTGA